MFVLIALSALLIAGLGFDFFGGSDDSSNEDAVQSEISDDQPQASQANASIEDLLAGTPGSDLIQGTEGSDLITGGNGQDTIDGQGGNDTLSGGRWADVIEGGAGSDLLDGGAGADILGGGVGNDSLDGGKGADSLLGNDGVDVLSGEQGSDYLVGGLGRDELYGGDGDDFLFGGRVNFDASSSGVSDFSAENISRIRQLFEDELDFAQTATAEDILDHPDLEGMDTSLIRSAIQDTSSDLLDGGDGNDHLYLENGDRGIGGSGEDVFVLNGDAPAEIIEILDYTQNDDRIIIEVETPDGTFPTLSVVDDGADAEILLDGTRAAVVVGAAGMISEADINFFVADRDSFS